ncbi:putative DNA-directed RNA polymerases I, II, and III [Triangularia verruculosa]|uniref:DNA-directed RNA polymerases I, II, and III subunit RPABC3 n=1 Tax=Triangularia verruculosa TaxID=2587418 RepID=A0AAN7AZ45_9PEZI|nr:putative DNA-directed RNA polymerases I, II, and III [Triangularia verruculosa]
MAGLGSDAQLFEDNFRVHKLSDKKYDRVDRIYATSEDKSIEIALDINNELFPCKDGDELHMVLATSLHYDGSKDDEHGWRDVAKSGASESTLADQFDYVCYGKIYKFEDGEDGQTIKAYISFGGLLMSLVGPYKKLTPLRVEYIYLLVRRR